MWVLAAFDFNAKNRCAPSRARAHAFLVHSDLYGASPTWLVTRLDEWVSTTGVVLDDPIPEMGGKWSRLRCIGLSTAKYSLQLRCVRMELTFCRRCAAAPCPVVIISESLLLYRSVISARVFRAHPASRSTYSCKACASFENSRRSCARQSMSTAAK